MKIALYLGSSLNCLDEYNAVAYNVGKAICTAGHAIVYGGANVGTMKHLADGAHSVGGEVIGVFPEFFKGTGEVSHKGIRLIREDLSELIIVRDFAERKQKMQDLSDCSLILPGSFGTLDELFTYVCNNAIGLHTKKAYILDWKGYYSPLRELLANMRDTGFMKPETVDIVNFCNTVEDFLVNIDQPITYQP